MSRQRTILTTIGIMLGLFMASMEATVIATAMPTIVSQLGGLAIYSWAFSAYMLTSTTTVRVVADTNDSGNADEDNDNNKGDDSNNDVQALESSAGRRLHKLVVQSTWEAQGTSKATTVSTPCRRRSART